jgi:hypothetical protein
MFESVTNPRFISADNQKIMCLVRFADLDGEHDYIACPNDSVPHGQELHAALLAGEYGEIAAYQAPVVPVNALISQAKRKRNDLLTASDWTQLPDIAAETKALWALYRQALRDVPTQKGFPKDITWPESPKA